MSVFKVTLTFLVVFTIALFYAAPQRAWAQTPKEIARAALDNPSDSDAVEAYLAILPQIDDRFVVDGDQRMTAREVRLWLRAQDAQQAAQTDPKMPELIVDAGGIWAEGQRQLTYAIARSEFAPSEYRLVRQTLSRAAAEWVEACQPCDLEIIHASAFDDAPNSDAVTFVVRKTMIDDIVALAFFPGDDPSERQLHITSRFFEADLPYDRVGVMRHEIGHILGYRHEHVRSRNAVCLLFYRETGEWRTIEGFEAHDPSSAMSYPCGGEGSVDFALTQIDRAAHREMYGAPRSANLAPAPALTTAPAAAALTGQAVQATEGPGPYIVIDFIGPTMTEDLFRLLADLKREGNERLLPARDIPVETGDYACEIYRDAWGLNGCPKSAAENLAQAFNETGTFLKAGGSFAIPDIEIETYQYDAEVTRSPYGSIEGLVASIGNEEFLQDLTVTASNGRSIVTLRGRRIELDAHEPDVARKILDVFRSGNYSNASVSVRRGYAPKIRYSVGTINEVVNSCRSEEAELQREGAYWTMLGDPDEWPQCALNCTGSTCPQIVLPDAIAHPQSDLDNALTFLDMRGLEVQYEQALQRSGSCEPYKLIANEESGCTVREFNPDCDHSTSMASIISSRLDDIGLAGLSPNAPISVYDWEHSSSRELADLVMYRSSRAYQQYNGPQLFVFASKFPNPEHELRDSRGEGAGDPDPRGHSAPSYFLNKGESELRDPRGRLSHPVASPVATMPALWITAAGQGRPGEVPKPLSRRSPFAPMNLGDQNNVIVVTACESCAWPNIRIDPTANYSATDSDSPYDGNAVTIAAPGDGYVAHENTKLLIEPHGGTSQATAFVGGVTTAMLRCNPDSYVDGFNQVRADRVKRRIILTSTPQLQGNPMTPVPGVINPSALLKDPEVTWVRRVGEAGEGYRESATPRICANQRLHFFKYDKATDRKYPDSVTLANTRRILRVPAALTGDPYVGERWFIYTTNPNSVGNEPSGWQANVIGPVRMEDEIVNAPIFHSEGGSDALVDYEEIILPFAALEPLPEGASQCPG